MFILYLLGLGIDIICDKIHKIINKPTTVSIVVSNWIMHYMHLLIY